MSFFSKILLGPISGLDVADQSVRFVELVREDGGFKLGRFGVRELPPSILREGKIFDPVGFSEELSLLRRAHGLERVRTTLPETHFFVAENAGLTPIASELRARALARALIHPTDSRTLMIVNFGRFQTDFSIFFGGELFLTTTFNGDIPLAGEIQDHMIFWRSRRDPNGRLRPPVQEIILAGSNVSRDELAQELSQTLGVPVSFGNPWTNAPLADKYVPPLHNRELLAYATAIGLALGK
jgi:Tfp pilus assembly PilM family ATPase